MADASDITWQTETDVLVVGSGSAGLIAALAADDADVLVLEKAPVLGGTTAVSGGGMWLPNAPPIVEDMGKTPRDEVRGYLDQIVGDHIPDEMIDTFIDKVPEVVGFLERESPLDFQSTGYPDYHVELEGGSVDGHMIEPTLYDGTRLGDKLENVREDPHHPFPVPVSEVYEAGGHAKFAEVADFEELAQRVEDGILATGRALISGLYEACLDAEVEFMTATPATELVLDGDRVVGVIASDDGDELAIAAGAVVIAAGGMEWDEEMCDNFLRGPIEAPATPPYAEGDGIKMGMEIGAKVGNMNEAWWFPTGHVPGEEWEDGSPLYRMVWGPRTLPGSLMVNEDGERFCNESANYHDLGKTFHEFDPNDYDYRNIPAYSIMDQDYREQYGILTVEPDQDTPSWLTEAETLDELADELGVDGETLAETVERFNANARNHEDPDFHRGESHYDQFVGDPEAAHPNLAPVDTPPYYALEILPGCIGTKGGLVTAPNGQVLSVDEEPIPGLFAASNSTRHVMGMGYAGAGASLGPNAVFGYLAGREAAAVAAGTK